MYLVVMRSWESWHLLLVSVPIVTIAWMSVGRDTPPTGGGAAVGPSRRGHHSAGRVVQPTLGAAHHPEVLGVFAVVHSPAVVFAVLQGLFRPIATNVVHPYGACGKTDGQAASGRPCHYTWFIVAQKRLELHDPKTQPPDFYQRTDLGFLTSCLFSSEIRGALQGVEGVPYV